MSQFETPIDICNRALQRVGAGRIDAVRGFTEQSKNASECAFVYDKLRRAELQRNVWAFAVKRTVIRPLYVLANQAQAFNANPTVAGAPTGPSMLLAPALWSSTTVYPSGALVSDISNVIWQCLSPANIGFAPGNSTAWEVYTGPMTVDPYNPTESYFVGDLVYVAPGDGTYVIYQSLMNGNAANPAVATAYVAGQVYARDDVVTYLGVPYQSIVDLNRGNTPLASPTQWSTVITSGVGSGQWRTVQAALQQVVVAYPMGAGQGWPYSSRSAYRLPANFLRDAPQTPKTGSNSWVGGPTGIVYDDWIYDGDYLVTGDAGAIQYRFVADITNVRQFSSMFCEGLAARIAYELCEPLTQSGAKLQACASAYEKFMRDARLNNAILEGPEESPDDEYVSVRW